MRRLPSTFVTVSRFCKSNWGVSLLVGIGSEEKALVMVWENQPLLKERGSNIKPIVKL